MARPIEQTKFAVYKQDVNKHDFFNKLVDTRAFFEVYPKAITYEELAPTRRRISRHAKGNLIGRDGNLMKTFSEFATVKDVNATTVQWKLYTKEGDIRASYLENPNPSITNPGIGGTGFEIVLDAQWFGPNDVLIFEDFKECPLLVTSSPEPYGSGYIYEVEILQSDRKGFYPLGYLKSGKRLLQIGSLIGEATIERGNINFGVGEAYVEFEVPMTRMGWQMKVTDEAWYAAKHFKMQKCMAGSNEVDEKETPFMFSSLDAKFEEKVNEQVDYWLTYGRSAGQYAGIKLDGLTQRDLKAGPGFYEYAEAATIFDFNVDGSNIDIFRDYIPTQWNDKVAPEDRKVVIYTGTGGLKLVDKWLREADIEPIQASEELNYGKEDALFKGRSGVSIGKKQYRAFYIEPFGHVKFEYMPMLDSTLTDGRRYKGLPYSSYQFLVFNFGYGDGREDNMYILRNRAFNQYGYAAGSWTPTGPRYSQGINNGRYGFSKNPMENAYWYIYETMIGLVIPDPSAIIFYRPNFV